MTQDEKIKELHARYVAPLKAAANRMFTSDDGAAVLAALERVFCDDTLPKDSTGAIDANAVLIHVGQRRVIDYLRTLSEPKKEGQGR